MTAFALFDRFDDVFGRRRSTGRNTRSYQEAEEELLEVLADHDLLTDWVWGKLDNAVDAFAAGRGPRPGECVCITHHTTTPDSGADSGVYITYHTVADAIGQRGAVELKHVLRAASGRRRDTIDQPEAGNSTDVEIDDYTDALAQLVVYFADGNHRVR